MINQTDLENAVFDWIISVLDIEVRVAHSKAKRPQVPYATINFITFTSLSTKGSSKRLEEDETVTITYATLNSLTVSINIFYENAYSNCIKLKHSLESVLVSEDLYSKGLGYLNTSDVRDIPSVINEEWEERAQIDVNFSVISEDTENIETIQKIEIENKINGEVLLIEKL